MLFSKAQTRGKIPSLICFWLPECLDRSRRGDGLRGGHGHRRRRRGRLHHNLTSVIVIGRAEEIISNLTKDSYHTSRGKGEYFLLLVVFWSDFEESNASNRKICKLDKIWCAFSTWWPQEIYIFNSQRSNITLVLRFLNLILMVFQPADHSREETKQVSLASALYKRRELVN